MMRASVRRYMASALLAIALISGMAIVPAAWFRVWSLEDVSLRCRLRGWPLAMQLWDQRYPHGHAIAEFRLEHPPHGVFREGSFECLEYFPHGPLPFGTISFVRILVIARDGRILAAEYGDSRVQKTFVTMTPDERREWNSLPAPDLQ